MPALPIQLASRLVLDSISYSNCLPPWRDGVEANFSAQERHVQARIREYLDGRKPEKPFDILVPRKNGTKKQWLIPSVTDQIALQSAVSGLARRIVGRIDNKRVFSYRLNTDPNRLLLTENQSRSWTQFQQITNSRLKEPSSFLLQFDLESAFQRIQRDRFFEFLENAAGKGEETRIIRVLIDAFAGDQPGLPLVNHSLFFLGNIYLSTVDEVVQRETPNFIRFVDDYRVFGDSKQALSDTFDRVNRALVAMGFALSERKSKLGSGSDYLEAIARAGQARTGESRTKYISAAVLSEIVPPEKLAEQVVKVVDEPEQSMNEGLGRMVLGAVRRMRLNEQVAQQMNYPESPLSVFDSEIEDKALVAKASKLLINYSNQPDEAWRAVWIAYVFSRELSAETCRAVHESPNALPVVKLWTPGGGARSEAPPTGDFSRDDLNYLEEGRIYRA